MNINSTNLLEFQNLPDEMKLHVFSFLGPAELATCSLVCQEWKKFSEDDFLWKVYKQLGMTKSELKELASNYSKIYVSMDEVYKGVQNFVDELPHECMGYFICDYSSNDVRSDQFIPTLFDFKVWIGQDADEPCIGRKVLVIQNQVMGNHQILVQYFNYKFQINYKTEFDPSKICDILKQNHSTRSSDNSWCCVS